MLEWLLSSSHMHAPRSPLPLGWESIPEVFLSQGFPVPRGDRRENYLRSQRALFPILCLSSLSLPHDITMENRCCGWRYARSRWRRRLWNVAWPGPPWLSKGGQSHSFSHKRPTCRLARLQITFHGSCSVIPTAPCRLWLWAWDTVKLLPPSCWVPYMWHNLNPPDRLCTSQRKGNRDVPPICLQQLLDLSSDFRSCCPWAVYNEYWGECLSQVTKRPYSILCPEQSVVTYWPYLYISKRGHSQELSLTKRLRSKLTCCLQIEKLLPPF